MANQVDNLTLNDDTTGLIRTVNPSSDDLVLSVDLTLQSGGVLTTDNIKRGTTDPNVALLAGNEGDVYQRTLASTGQLWVNTNGATTGWLQAVLDADGIITWAETLANGNVSGGTDVEISSGDTVVGEANGAGAGGDLPITAGSSTGGNGDGGDVILTPGSGNGTGVDGIVSVNGPKHYANSATDPTAPTPAEGDRYYNTILEMEMRFDGSRSKWLSVESDVIFGSDANNLPSGAFLEMGSVRMSSTRGFTAPHNGTVVSLSWTRDDSDSMDWGVTADGTTFSTTTSAAISGKDNTLNDDFDEDDVLGIRNDGAGIPNDSIVWIRVKWRD